MNSNGLVDRGDEVRLRFTAGRGALLAAMPLLLPATNNWGEGARVQANRAADALVVTLGASPKLNLYETYSPGRPGATPAQVVTATGPVPVQVNHKQRRKYVGERLFDSADLRPYYGQLHSHTELSDGRGQPRDAFTMARANGLDFFGVTDHLEFLNLKSWKWDRLIEEANQANEPGRFLALRGFEWGGIPTRRGWINHINVIEPLGRPSVLRITSLDHFYDVLTAARADSVAMFNHPGMKRAGRIFPMNHWNNFRYRADADLHIQLIRTETQTEHTDRVGYIRALDRGWHLSPEADEDNHKAAFGATARRTGVWARELTRDAVMAGLRSSVTFFTNVPGAAIKLLGDGRWLMGSTLYGSGAHRLRVEVTYPGTASGARPAAGVPVGPAGIDWVELVSFRGDVVARFAPGPLPYVAELDVNPQTDTYYYARGHFAGGGDLISAPLFIDR